MASAWVYRFMAMAPQIRPSMFRQRPLSRTCVSLLRCFRRILLLASISLRISYLTSLTKLPLGERFSVGRTSVSGSGLVVWELRLGSLVFWSESVTFSWV